MVEQSKKPIKSILCVHQGYELYGSDRSFALSVGILKTLYPTVKVSVVIPKEGPIRQLLEPVSDELIIDENLGVLRRKELKKAPFRLLYKIIRGALSAVVSSKKYDLVYINTIVVVDYILAARFMKASAVLHIREIPTGLQQVFFNKLVSFSKLNIIFNSSSTSQAFRLPIKQNKAVLLNGVKGFPDVAKIAHSGVNILLIGRLTEWKGQMFFLKALSQLLKHKNYDIKVRIVGDVFENQIEYKEALQGYVQTHDLEEKVTFSPFTDNPESEYEWSDIVVIPSTKPEPFGRVAIEAMSARRCVIAANHGGLTEIVEDKQSGVLFDANNIDSFIFEIQQLLDTPILIGEYAERGLQVFKNKFSEETYKENFSKLMLDVE